MREKRPAVSKNFSKRLKQLRDAKGWSQGQLAKKIGANPKQISKYETDTIFPTVDMMIKLAGAFSISLDDLIFDERKVNLKDIPNQELIDKFDQISRLNQDSQKALLIVMDGLIKKNQLEQLAQS